MNRNYNHYRYDVGRRHNFWPDFSAGDLTCQYHVGPDGRIVVMDYIFGTTDWGDFIKDFVAEVDRNRYRGFIKLNIHLDGKRFSWFFRKFDLYLVAIHDGYDLYELGEYGTSNRWLSDAILTGYRERYSDLLNNGRIVDTLLSAEIFENAARKVLENVGQTSEWKNSFGIYALMFSEPARFTWFAEAVKNMMTTAGNTMLLAAEGQGEFDWAAYIPNKWTVICNCLRNRLKVPRPIVHQRLTLAGAKELETNPAAAKTAIWTETWDKSWLIDDGVSGGGGPGGSRGGGSLGARGGGSRGGIGGGSLGGRGGGGSRGGRGGGGSRGGRGGGGSRGGRGGGGSRGGTSS